MPLKSEIPGVMISITPISARLSTSTLEMGQHIPQSFEKLFSYITLPPNTGLVQQTVQIVARSAITI